MCRAVTGSPCGTAERVRERQHRTSLLLRWASRHLDPSWRDGRSGRRTSVRDANWITPARAWRSGSPASRAGDSCQSSLASVRSAAAETTASTSIEYVPVDFLRRRSSLPREQASVSAPFVALMYLCAGELPTRRQPHLVGRIEIAPDPAAARRRRDSRARVKKRLIVRASQLPPYRRRRRPAEVVGAWPRMPILLGEGHRTADRRSGQSARRRGVGRPTRVAAVRCLGFEVAT